MRLWSARRARTVVPLVLLAALFVSERRALAASLVGFSSLEPVAPGVWVDPEMPAAQRAQVLTWVTDAAAQLDAFYGSTRAPRRIILGSRMDRLGPFANNEYGSTLYSPLGATVVIGPEGLNADVITHELAHAELFARLGWWRNLVAMPVWFDEGLAMQFDHRERYGAEAYRALEQRGGLVPLTSLWSGAQFFDEHAADHYVQVKHDVAECLSRAGPEGLRAVIDRVAAGGDFEAP
ncbi:MAG: hypothetical protein U0228_04905 [Myxococcaceae bacterium]